MVGQFRVYRWQADTRLRDYAAGLRFWLGLDDARLGDIVLVENSGYPLDALQEIARHANPFGRRVEFVAAPTMSYPAHVHYGYAELDMLETALHDSALLADGAYFVKANGRLRFPSVSHLLDRLPADYLFAVDSRRSFVPGWPERTARDHAVDAVFDGVLRATVLGRGPALMNATGHLEAFFYNALCPFQGTPGAILRWPINVPPVGQAAHWRKSYDAPRQRAVNLGRAMLRKVAPNVWL